jgi:hemerythrin
VAVTWSESLTIGVPAIDGQHRELFERVAAFETALERGDLVAVAETFGFLRAYAATHFADEEALMREGGYPAADAHVAQHREFAARLEALVRDQRDDARRAFVGLRARNWITVWLLDHVGVADQALGAYLRLARGAAAPLAAPRVDLQREPALLLTSPRRS